MGLSFYSNSEINKKIWDDSLEDCTNRMIYAYSWWLDIVSPGWSALWDKENKLLFPLPQRKKFGITYVYPPAFTQQLGFFYSNPVPIKNSLLNQIPHKFIELNLNEGNTIAEELNAEVLSRRNAVLDLSTDYESLLKNYSENHRRNISKASENVVEEMNNAEEIITLFKQNKGDQLGVKTRDYQILDKLFTELEKRGLLNVYAVRKGTEIVAGAAIVKSFNRLIFLFSGQSDRGKECRAMFSIIDHVIRINSGTKQFLDFEGSNNTGLMRFYLGFGGSELVYLQLKKNRLPRLVRFFKR